MKLRVLVDNNTFIDEYYFGEPGLSYYIEDGDDKILFDTGYSGVFLKNAELMNIDLDSVNKIVLSHGHDDHTRGLKYFFEKERKVELITHTLTLEKKIGSDGSEIGSPLKKDELEKMVKLTLSDKPVKISENITFLGEIPTKFDFEKRYSIGKILLKNYLKDDFIIEDSALVYKAENGIFVITGCSHSGICNIIEYAKEVANDDRVLGVIGGFHLLQNNDRLSKTINYLKNEEISCLYPCHCVSLSAKLEMGKAFEIHEVGVGLEINI